MIRRVMGSVGRAIRAGAVVVSPGFAGVLNDEAMSMEHPQVVGQGHVVARYVVGERRYRELLEGDFLHLGEEARTAFTGSLQADSLLVNTRNRRGAPAGWNPFAIDMGSGVRPLDPAWQPGGWCSLISPSHPAGALMSFIWRYVVRPGGSFCRVGNHNGGFDHVSDEELTR